MTSTATRICLIACLFLPLSLFAQLDPGPLIQAGVHPIVADFNNDGLDDLIMLRTVFINTGSHFVAARELELQGSDGVVDVLDVNGDGRLDLLTVDNLRGAPWSQTGTYGWARYRLYMADAGMGYPDALVRALPAEMSPYIADLDSDGRDDLVLLKALFQGVRETGTRVEVLRSLGNGEFEPRGTQVIAPGTQFYLQTRHLASGDLNNDGHKDIVIRCLDDLVVITGRGDGSLNPAQTRFLASDVGTVGLRLADMDGDRNLDVVFANEWPQPFIHVFFNDGRASFRRSAAARLHTRTGIKANSPRTLATMRRGQSTQIAAGTDDGDIVVFGMRGQELVELSRTATWMEHLNIYAGSFREPDSSDLYASPTYTVPGSEPPRIYFGARHTPGPATQQETFGGRRRSTAHISVPLQKLEFDVHVADSGNETWQFTTEGMFAIDRNELRLVEAVIDPDVMYLRLTRGTEAPVVAKLWANGPDRYDGTLWLAKGIKIVVTRK